MAEYSNIFLTRDAPLIVRDPSANMHYGTVYMEMGAYIEIRAGVRFQIEELVMADDKNKKNSYFNNDYPTLKEGEKRESWNYHIIVTGEQGKDGQNGEDGKDWGESGQLGKPGSSGKNAPQNYTITIKELGFDLTVLSVGGAGGNGGNGGNGANGYDGESSDKPGGIAGDGGAGGNGGNSGDATKKLIIKYASKNDFQVSVDCIAASGGIAGQGGISGRNGKYYNGTTKPQDGANGSQGLSGKPGEAEIQKI